MNVKGAVVPLEAVRLGVPVAAHAAERLDALD